MLKPYFYSFIVLFFFTVNSFAQSNQVSGIITDYQGFWQTSNNAPNNVRPENSHQLLSFTLNGTRYSTGVDNNTLEENGITDYQDTRFRALPVQKLPSYNSTNEQPNSYFIGLAQLYDGIDNGIDPSLSEPFNTFPDAEEIAGFLTMGSKGLNLGTCVANIPSNQPESSIELSLSETGITEDMIGDGVPDLIVSQIAQPSGTTDNMRFVDANGMTIGSNYSIFFGDNTGGVNNSNFQTVGTQWLVDFYNPVTSNQTNNNFIKTARPFRFLAIDVSEMGVTTSNYQSIKSLRYSFGGASDPAFIAFNENSVGISSALQVVSQPVTANCDGTFNQNFEVQLTDINGSPVNQSGFEITASLISETDTLLGNLTATTNANGIAVFDDLSVEEGNGTYTIEFNNSSLDTGVSNPIIVENCNSLTWTGGATSNWNDSDNWVYSVDNTLAGVFPDADYNVVVPNTNPLTGESISMYPVLADTARADNLTISPDAMVNLNGTVLEVKGNLNNGSGQERGSITADQENSELLLSGDSLQVIPESFINGDLANFTMENQNGVQTETQMNITEVFKVNNGEFTTNDNLVMVCNFDDDGASQGTGQIARVGGTINGDVTVEQCYPAKRAYRFVTSSVTTSTSIRENWQEDATSYLDVVPEGYGTHITGINLTNAPDSDGLNGFDYNPSGNPSMFVFNNGSQSWSQIGNTDVNTLTAGQPYRMMIRGDRTIDITNNQTPPTDTKLRAKGEAVTGNLIKDGQNFNFSTSEGDYNLFGNPYHAIVDMSAVVNNPNTTNINPNFYYIWDPTLSDRGAYVAISLVDNTTSIPNNLQASANNTEANRFLQPMQAAFVQTLNDEGSPQLEFNENDKAVDETQTATMSLEMNNTLNAVLYNENNYTNGNTARDGMVITFKEGGDNTYTTADALKLGNDQENLCRVENGNYIALEYRSLPQDGDSLPLFINQYQSQDYVLHLKPKQAFEHEALLYDAFLGNYTVIDDEGLAYDFTVNASDASAASDRFSIVFGQASLGLDNEKTGEFTVYPNPTDGHRFTVEVPAGLHGQEIEVTVQDMQGRRIVNRNATISASGTLHVDHLNLSTGVYMLNIHADNAKKTLKLIVK